MNILRSVPGYIRSFFVSGRSPVAAATQCQSLQPEMVEDVSAPNNGRFEDASDEDATEETSVPSIKITLVAFSAEEIELGGATSSCLLGSSAHDVTSPPIREGSPVGHLNSCATDAVPCMEQTLNIAGQGQSAAAADPAPSKGWRNSLKAMLYQMSAAKRAAKRAAKKALKKKEKEDRLWAERSYLSSSYPSFDFKRQVATKANLPPPTSISTRPTSPSQTPFPTISRPRSSIPSSSVSSPRTSSNERTIPATGTVPCTHPALPLKTTHPSSSRLQATHIFPSSQSQGAAPACPSPLAAQSPTRSHHDPAVNHSPTHPLPRVSPSLPPTHTLDDHISFFPRLLPAELAASGRNNSSSASLHAHINFPIPHHLAQRCSSFPSHTTIRPSSSWHVNPASAAIMAAMDAHTYGQSTLTSYITDTLYAQSTSSQEQQPGSLRSSFTYATAAGSTAPPSPAKVPPLSPRVRAAALSPELDVVMDQEGEYSEEVEFDWDGSQQDQMAVAEDEMEEDEQAADDEEDDEEEDEEAAAVDDDDDNDTEAEETDEDDDEAEEDDDDDEEEEEEEEAEQAEAIGIAVVVPDTTTSDSSQPTTPRKLPPEPPPFPTFSGPLDVENASIFAHTAFSEVLCMDGKTLRFSADDVSSVLSHFEWDPAYTTEVIGKGSFGTVYKCVELTLGLVASKEIILRSCWAVRDFCYEAVTLMWVNKSAGSDQGRTPTLQVYRVGFKENENGELVGQLVTEVCYCTLYQRLEEQAQQVRDCKIQSYADGLSMDDTNRAEVRTALPHLSFNLELLVNLADVLGLLKTLHIAHNDLKPCNIFIVRRHYPDGSGYEEYAVIADMGLALDIAEGWLYRTCPLGVGGTIGYTAPEVLPYNDYVLNPGDAVNTCSFAADMYAFGLIKVHVLQGVMSYAAALAPDLIYLAEECLSTDPYQRPDAPRMHAVLYNAAQSVRITHMAEDAVDCIMACAVRPSAHLEAAHGKLMELARYLSLRLTMANSVQSGGFVAFAATFKDANIMIAHLKRVFGCVGCGDQLRWYLNSVSRHRVVEEDYECLQDMVIEIY